MGRNRHVLKWIKNRVERRTLSRLLKSKMVRIFLLPFILFLALFLILVPKVKLVGNVREEVTYNGEYIEKGVKASFLGNDVTKYVMIDGGVNTKKLGEQIVTYNLDKYIFKVKKTRVVVVKDLNKPVITLTGEKEVNVCPNADYVEEGYTALDDVDKDLTKNVKITKEKDKVIYTVKDKSGNESMVKRKINHVDVVPPVITLNGSSVIYTIKNAAFNDPLYTAVDNCDGDITSKVIVEGSVNTGVVGTYPLIYKVVDNAGNEAMVERKVVVSAGFTADHGISKPGVIYLTFDDGPQEGTTNVILDILKEEGVKATFFVTNKGPDYLIKREADEGHTVALHTASHDYATIYSSVDNFFYDLALVHDRVQRITGIDSRITRFPGGSSNTVSRRYSLGIMSVLSTELLNRGYRYYDWNISSGDAGNTTDPNQVFLNVVRNLSHDRPNMVLMHDIKWYTRDALRNIITYGKDNNFRFEAITMDTAMIRQRINN